MEFQRLKLQVREETHEEDEADLAGCTTHVTQGKDPNIGRPMAISDKKGMKRVAGVIEGRLSSDFSTGSKLKEKKKAEWVKQVTADKPRKSATLIRNRFNPLYEDPFNRVSSSNPKENQSMYRVNEKGKVRMGPDFF